MTSGSLNIREKMINNDTEYLLVLDAHLNPLMIRSTRKCCLIPSYF